MCLLLVEDLLKLFVQDDKGGVCLICDEGVAMSLHRGITYLHL